MKAILLSIKPEYVERILAGTKKYEYRKRLARNKSSILLVYSTDRKSTRQNSSHIRRSRMPSSA